MSQKTSLIRSQNGSSYLFPFILITSLFFLWGFAHSLLDVLNKHFQEVLHISKAQSGLVQAAVYGGYFLAAIPAGLFMNRYGYKRGIILGLLLYAAGSFLFLPAIGIREFWAFLTALFIIAIGLTCLETAANPYATILGPKETGAQRLNLSQSFNGLGWIAGPLAGSLIIFSASGSDRFSALAIPYIAVGTIVLMVALLFFRTKLPEVSHDAIGEEQPADSRGLWQHRHFILAILAQFFYVAAQTGINSFFINYTVDIFHEAAGGDGPGAGILAGFSTMVSNNHPGISPEAVYNISAGLILSFGGMMLFMAGRFAGSLFMSWYRPERLLVVYSLVCTLLMAVVISGAGIFGILALCLSYFFMSIMFPTIFALGIRGMGRHTKRASSFIIMAIVGGAICPPLMGYIADTSSMRTGFIVPLICFAVVFYYGFSGQRIIPKTRI